MKNRYRHVIDEGDLEETRKLLKDYHNALLQIKQANLDATDDETIWIDKSTPLALWLDMHLQEVINVENVENNI